MRRGANMRALGRDVGKIGAGDDCPYSGVCPRLFGIDRYDPGVSVGATLDPAPKHTRDRHVGAAVEQPWVAQLPAIHVLREVWTSWFSACLPSRCARCRPLLRSGRNPMIVMVTSGYALLLATAWAISEPTTCCGSRQRAAAQEKATRSAAATGGGTERVGEIPPCASQSSD